MTVAQLQELSATKLKTAIYSKRAVRFDNASRKKKAIHFIACKMGLHDPTITHSAIQDNQVGFQVSLATSCGWCRRALSVEYAWGDWPK